MVAVVRQPVRGQLGLVGAGVGLAGVELLLPAGHGLAVGGQALDVPGQGKKGVLCFFSRQRLITVSIPDVSLRVQQPLRPGRHCVEDGLHWLGEGGAAVGSCSIKNL